MALDIRPGLTRWEYCEVTATSARFYTLAGEDEIEFHPDRARGDKGHSEPRARFIAQLGLDGWELVSATIGNARGGFAGIAHYEQPVLYFKRRTVSDSIL